MHRYPLALVRTCLGVALLSSSLLWAQEGPGGGQPQRREGGGRGGGPGMRLSPVMQALDTDKDGELSTEEINNASKALRALDKDNDGKLSAEELRPAGMGQGTGGPRGGQNTAEALARLMANDQNKDGKLSADELPERMRALVTRADADKDGFATREELTKALEQQQGQGRQGRGERRPEQ